MKKQRKPNVPTKPTKIEFTDEKTGTVYAGLIVETTETQYIVLIKSPLTHAGGLYGVWKDERHRLF